MSAPSSPPAATSPTNPARKANKLQRPPPAPAGLRPLKAKNQLPLLNLFWVPKRIFVPPKPTVGTVRSFKSTPLAEVRLEDVLDNKHLAPLSLKDFEVRLRRLAPPCGVQTLTCTLQGHLVFREHSAENLYFDLCESRAGASVRSRVARGGADSSLYANAGIREYTKEYNAYMADPSTVKVAAVHSENTDPNAERSASH